MTIGLLEPSADVTKNEAIFVTSFFCQKTTEIISLEYSYSLY